jgi:hypothetical protein
MWTDNQLPGGHSLLLLASASATHRPGDLVLRMEEGTAAKAAGKNCWRLSS